MKLRYSPTSPYVRKVTASIIELELEDYVERVATNPWDTDTDLPRDNPLGKVPALVKDDGTVLFDSCVICEYLDSLSDRAQLFPPVGEPRWRVLRLQALADGIMDAAVLRLLESRRPQPQQSPEWVARQRLVVQRALDMLEKEAGSWQDAADIGLLACACALGYLDLRYGDEPWRAERPALRAWFDGFSRRPSVRDTMPPEA
jgi:glutathione S-transferase